MMSSNLSYSGNLRINGNLVDNVNKIGNQVAYVMQDDILLATFTPYGKSFGKILITLLDFRSFSLLC